MDRELRSQKVSQNFLIPKGSCIFSGSSLMCTTNLRQISTKSLISALKTRPGRRGGGWGNVVNRIELCLRQVVKRPRIQEANMPQGLPPDWRYIQGARISPWVCSGRGGCVESGASWKQTELSQFTSHLMDTFQKDQPKLLVLKTPPAAEPRTP